MGEDISQWDTVGPEHSFTGTGWTAFDDIISGWSAGNTLEIWIRSDSTACGTKIQNFEIRGTAIIMYNSVP